KTQKLEDPPDMPAIVAADILGRAAEAQEVDARVNQRMATVQDILRDDLAWIEASLASAVEEGEVPATHAARHLVTRGGKRVRPIALLLSAACFGRISLAAREMAAVAELVHSATLLHDDVVDEGMERRGAPTSRLSWGNAVSVLGGDLLLVHALSRTQTHAPEVMPDLIATLRRLVDGEIIQLRGRSELDVSEATYERILRDKTASLFAWSTRTGARLAGAGSEEQERMAGFGERLGIAFQLVDDVLDYSGADTGKTLFSDLREGKLTLPLVLAVARMPELVQPLKRIYAGDREPVALVSRAVVESGACDEVRRRASEHTHAAVDALARVKPGPARVLLEAVAEQLAARAA
ncbi:MAG TPA: polyprenyl synthetase family protein, partial [Polyangiaceae bacterium]|nr:polyprenyl synthetase family protein [Polyangiaceae bacterium]